MKILWQLSVDIVQELINLTVGLLIFLPMLVVWLLVFMFFQQTMTLEQGDTLMLVAAGMFAGWLTGMLSKSKVESFWKKN